MGEADGWMSHWYEGGLKRRKEEWGGVKRSEGGEEEGGRVRRSRE